MSDESEYVVVWKAFFNTRFLRWDSNNTPTGTVWTNDLGLAHKYTLADAKKAATVARKNMKRLGLKVTIVVKADWG